MKNPNKKKIGYKQYEKLLSLAHQKSEILAERYKELQTYFMGYLEYKGDNVSFGKWMNDRILKDQISKNEQLNEKV